MAIQMTLSKELKLQMEHGGTLAIGKRKTKRPVVTKRPMHVVLRTVEGAPNLIRYQTGIHEILTRHVNRFSVQTYERAICSNHIHLAVRSKTREGFLNFLRAICGRIAQLAKKSSQQKFWESIPYTRIVQWGRHFLRLLKYVRQNTLEADGRLAYQPRYLQQKKRSPGPGAFLGRWVSIRGA